MILSHIPASGATQVVVGNHNYFKRWLGWKRANGGNLRKWKPPPHPQSSDHLTYWDPYSPLTPEGTGTVPGHTMV